MKKVFVLSIRIDGDKHLTKKKIVLRLRNDTFLRMTKKSQNVK